MCGVEYHSLRVGENSQITLHKDNGIRYLLYTEDVSKTCQGCLKHCKIVPKKVHAYENLAQPDHCIVKLYLKYLSLQPSKMKTSTYGHLLIFVKIAGTLVNQ